MAKNDLTAVVLTRNEEKNLPRCFKSLGFADQFLVIDDFSEDNTVKVAKEFDISTYKTLELLKLMHNNGFLTMKQIRAIAAYWVYQNDMPKSYRKDYKRIFSEDPPGP